MKGLAKNIGLGDMELKYIYLIFVGSSLLVLGLVIYLVKKVWCKQKKNIKGRLFKKEHSLEDHKLNIEMPSHDIADESQKNKK